MDDAETSAHATAKGGDVKLDFLASRSCIEVPDHRKSCEQARTPKQKTNRKTDSISTDAHQQRHALGRHSTRKLEVEWPTAVDPRVRAAGPVNGQRIF